jgi:hypothetical protein
VTVTNDNPRVAFRNLIYRTRYWDGDADIVREREDVIKIVLQPGEMKHFEVVDTIIGGRAPDETVSGSFEVVAAEALLPASGS